MQEEQRPESQAQDAQRGEESGMPDVQGSEMQVMHEEQESPKAVLGAFVRGLLEYLGEETEGWPSVSQEAYCAVSQKLRVQLEGLYAYAGQRGDVGLEALTTLRIAGESAFQLLRLDWQEPAETFAASPETLALMAGRPKPLLSLDQLYCTPDSTERRMRHLLQELPNDAKVLLLGDDDLGSVLLGPPFAGEVHVVEFDDRLNDFIRARNEKVQTHNIDLIKGGMPASFLGAFDGVVLDPPWVYRETWGFLAKAIYCLKEDRHARIFLSYCPLHIEHLEKKLGHFWRRLFHFGLTCEALLPALHLYDLRGTEFAQVFHEMLPSLDSGLLALLRELPYGFSNLYVLRRLPGVKVAWWRQALLRWWHSA